MASAGRSRAKRSLSDLNRTLGPAEVRSHPGRPMQPERGGRRKIDADGVSGHTAEPGGPSGALPCRGSAATLLSPAGAQPADATIVQTG